MLPALNCVSPAAVVSESVVKLSNGVVPPRMPLNTVVPLSLRVSAWAPSTADIKATFTPCKVVAAPKLMASL